MITILSVLLAVWLAVSAAYSVIRLNAEKDSLRDSCEIKFSQLVQEILSYSEVSSGSITNVVLGQRRVDTYSNTNILAKELNGKKIVDTRTEMSFNFGMKTANSESSSDVSGTINYSDFRQSLSYEQFAEIADYLNKPEDENGISYELICSEFYCAMDNPATIIPKQVQIVESEQWHVWHVEDKVIKTYELDCDSVIRKAIKNGGSFYIITEDSLKDGVYYIDDQDSINVEEFKKDGLCKISDAERNIIYKDFFFNRFGGEDLIAQLEETAQDDDTSAVKPMSQISPFEYIYYDQNYLSYVKSISYSAEDDETTTHIASARIGYAEKVNILSTCFGELINSAVILLFFFAIIGALLWLMTWRQIKAQSMHEQKQRDITNALAHDIKTPLFVISGYAQNLKDNVDNEKRNHYADVIMEQTRSVNDLVHRMLEMSKLDSVNFKLKKLNFKFNDLLDDVLKNYSILPDGKFINYHIDGEYYLDADRELIKCMLENLIDNAIKYSLNDTGIDITINAKKLEITNYCEPIDKKSLKQLWDAYKRVDQNSRSEGNGLGLSIVKSICQLHGYKYSVKQKEGKITFSFRVF